MNNFVLMAGFNAWVNARLYQVVAGLPDRYYRADGGLYFGSIHATLNHLLVVDRLWTARIRGVEHGIAALDQILYDDFAELRAARTEEDRRLIAFVEGLSEADLARPMTYRRMLGTGAQTTRCDHILLTLFNHQTHHRGQIHARLTRHGVEPPPLDVIYYLEEIGLS